ncbi:bZIP transcription factor 27-like isoform X2 [Manihot esculenta]|uniref:bZIP transcription factor 27-like isoform X2 n=1 Tax=Manihot esculenta TaxID=3983 RepID=UPI001CC66161|nr:bZIP transcription factor 27-like isoform X2 [Manihot esculenta]
MRSSPERNDNNSRSISSSPSKSSSICSSPSSDQAVNTSSSVRKSMEDVWKDINLTCLQECPISNPNHHRPVGMILQDFLVRPFNKDSPTPPSSAGRATDFPNSLAPRTATILTLNSGPSPDILESDSVRTRPNNPQLHTHASIGALGSSSAFPSICKKRVQENDDNTSDRRHKRMIKNRESAARSRARKQAYTQELEQEVANLQKENARLRRQQEKFQAAPAQLLKKPSLYRTSTAPF